MSLIKGITKIALSPLRGIKEIGDDLSGKPEDDTGIEQAGAVSTLGISSLIKGTYKGIKEGVDDIFDSQFMDLIDKYLDGEDLTHEEMMEVRIALKEITNPIEFKEEDYLPF